MLAEKKKKDDRCPDSRYKFFPTKEDWTWERREAAVDNLGSVLGTGSRREVGTGGAAEQGRGVPDRGWEGMRARRVQEDTARLAGSVRLPAIRSKDKGKDKDTTGTRPATQTLSQRSQPGVLTQGSNRGEGSSGNSRVRPEASSGRQSVLGDYWNTDALAADQLDENEPNYNTDADPWF
jgi:hypothetical protein